MKKALAFAFALLAVSHSASAGTFVENINQAVLRASFNDIQVLDLINWKVGDYANFQISAGPFGKVGDLKKAVTKEEGKAIWVVAEAAMMGQNDKSEMLINRADGKILKYIHNGKEEAIPSGEIEVLDQEYTEVKVPAGTFKCIHLTIKTPDVEKAEIWANPNLTVMEGLLKQTVNQNGIDVAVELVKFGRASE